MTNVRENNVNDTITVKKTALNVSNTTDIYVYYSNSATEQVSEFLRFYVTDPHCARKPLSELRCEPFYRYKLCQSNYVFFLDKNLP